MSRYILTFDEDEAKRIYDLPDKQKQLKSGELYVNVVVAILAIAVGTYYVIQYDISEQTLAIFGSYASAIYFGNLFWTKRKRLLEDVASVYKFIDKYKNSKEIYLDINGNEFLLSIDQTYTHFHLNETLVAKTHDDFVYLSFANNNILLPKKAFKENEWEQFLAELPYRERATTKHKD